MPEIHSPIHPVSEQSHAPTSNPAPATASSIPDVSTPRSSQLAHLAAVRLGPRDGYDRLVLEFADMVPGYTIGYRPLPVHQDASGAEIPLPGANAAVHIALSSATASGWTDGERTYFGPSTVTADTAVITEATAAGDFEAVLSWVVGVRADVPFTVTVLDGPPRLVVDFQH